MRPPNVISHMAYRLDHFIVIIDASLTNYCNVWTYNLYNQQWMTHTVPTMISNARDLVDVCGAAIGHDIYISMIDSMDHANDLYKLRRTEFGSFAWTCVTVKDGTIKPFPRLEPAAWEYSGKMWIFGGRGTPLNGFLNDYGDYDEDNYGYNNQLVTFDPVSKVWSNPKCFGGGSFTSKLPNH